MPFVKVTVIVPTYNRENCITKALDSILNQTYPDYEIVVIDDGSTDNTETILKRYGNKIKYFYKSNGGPASARNLGIRTCSGEYIAFLDSDDTWLPNKLDLQISVLEKDNDAGLVFSDMYLADEKDKNLFSDLTHPSEGKVFLKLLKNNFIPTSSVVLRKTCLQKTGLFNESKTLIGIEDYHLWIRLAKFFTVKYINKPLVNYYLGGDRLGSDSRINKLTKIIEVFNDLNKTIELNYREKYIFSKIKAKLLYESGRYLSKTGPPKESIKKFMGSIRLNPFYLRSYYFLVRNYLISRGR